MEVRVKPIAADSWSGKFRYPKCNDVLRPYLKRRGGLYTGLTPQDEKRLGDALGIDLRQGSDYWSNFKITIGTETVVLDLDYPLDEVKYLFLKNHKYVKDSISTVKASARYYLHNPEEEAGIINEHNRVKRAAIKYFDKMKPTEWRKALRLYGDSASNVSDSVAEERLFGRIEMNPEHFMKIWAENANRNEEFIIKEALAKGVLRKNKNIHYYGTITLGNTLEDTVAFLNSKENSDIKAAIINEADIK